MNVELVLRMIGSILSSQFWIIVKATNASRLFLISFYISGVAAFLFGFTALISLNEINLRF